MRGALQGREVIKRPFIDRQLYLPLEPWDYCLEWVPKYYKVDPDEYGFRAACVREISQVLGISKSTVKNWGARLEQRPEYAARLLRREHIINSIREKLPLPTSHTSFRSGTA